MSPTPAEPYDPASLYPHYRKYPTKQSDIFYDAQFYTEFVPYYAIVNPAILS